jgi:C6 transcription factor Pro1
MFQTMLAIAETSTLAEWKEAEMGKGSLDLHRLSDEGRRIESTFLTWLSPAQADAFITTSDDSTCSSNLPLDRPNAAAVFRAAARVYLHTVISGSFPEAKHVANAVDEVIQCFKEIPKTDADRSFVFSLCVTACMARSQMQKDFFLDRFQALKAVDRVGNCFSVSSQNITTSLWHILKIVTYVTGPAVGGGGLEKAITSEPPDSSGLVECCEGFRRTGVAGVTVF